MRNEYSNHWYLEPDDLVVPWTPTLLLLVKAVEYTVGDYKHWNDVGDLRWDWWDGGDPSDPKATRGERVFQVAEAAFRAAGLDDAWQYDGHYDGENTPRVPCSWPGWVEGQRRIYRRRVRWLDSDMHWVPFQVDFNSIGFYTVDAPHVWQVIVDLVRQDHGTAWDGFLGEARMGDLRYIRSEIPGPHVDLTRKHEPRMPLGYGASTKMPTFGYRREHRSEIVLAGWAAANDMDLFNDSTW